jgi:cation diffusion facilitator CzcD-associated flavoprotein CzcO
MKRIVIVDAGFAGLAAAKALRHSDAEVFVVDRANHTPFQLLHSHRRTIFESPSKTHSPTASAAPAASSKSPFRNCFGDTHLWTYPAARRRHIYERALRFNAN